MGEKIKCFVKNCKRQFETVQAIKLHFNISHQFGLNNEVCCIQNKCRRTFSTFQTFKSHLMKKHGFPEKKIVNPKPANQVERPSYNEILPSTSLVTDNVFDNDEKLENDFHVPMNCDEDEFSETELASNIEFLAASFCAKLYSNPVIPRKEVQYVVESTMELLSSGFVPLFKKILKSADSHEESKDDRARSNEIIQLLDTSFQNLATEKLRLRYFEKSEFLINPVSFYVGNMECSKNVGNRTTLNLVKQTAEFVPLRAVLKKFFEAPNVLSAVLKNINELETAKGDTYHFMQSPLWAKIKASQAPGKLLLPIFLFHDDVEINNPLGTHAGIHKLGATYISIPAIPNEYFSRLENIFLALLCHASDRAQNGNLAMFHLLIDELKYLETKGIQLQFSEKESKTIYFSLALILGDNLGMNQILGFSESFNSHHYCRFCIADKCECKKATESDSSLSRTEKNYCVGSFGVTENCVWNEVPSYRVYKNKSGDHMHDLREGICRYELGLTLNYFIIEKNFFTLDRLNERIKCFYYGKYESNTPPMIKIESIKNGYVIMSAAEMSCLYRYLGLIIGDLVPENDPVWELYLMLKEIISVVNLKIISHSTPKYLKLLIKDHHELFLQLFKDQDLKPKHHFITHYPEIMEEVGPLAHISCMRYEARHRPIKTGAKATPSRVNITKTLAKKNQLNFAERIMSEKGFGPSSTFGPLIENNNSNSISGYKWVIINQIKYIPKITVLFTGTDELTTMPEFCLIDKIFLDDDDDVNFSLNKLQVFGFNSHVDAYEVRLLKNPCLCTVKFSSITDIFPTSGILRYGNTGDTYVCFR